MCIEKLLILNIQTSLKHTLDSTVFPIHELSLISPAKNPTLETNTGS